MTWLAIAAIWGTNWIWHTYPGFWTAVLSWVAYVVFLFLSMKTLSPFLFLGALSNGAVVLVNGGYMPVVGPAFASIGVWVHANESHHLLPLADHMWMYGFSVGDILLGIGLVDTFWRIRGKVESDRQGPNLPVVREDLPDESL